MDAAGRCSAGDKCHRTHLTPEQIAADYLHFHYSSRDQSAEQRRAQGKFIAPRPEEPPRTPIATPILDDTEDDDDLFDTEDADDHFGKDDINPADIADAPEEPPRCGVVMQSSMCESLIANGYRNYHRIRDDLPDNPLMVKQYDTETIE